MKGESWTLQYFREHPEHLERILSRVDTPTGAKKKLRDISRVDWVVWNWDSITIAGEEEQTLIRGQMRTPDEAYQAGIEYDATWLSQLFKGIQQ